MDGENNEKPYEQMDDLGGFPIIFGNTHLLSSRELSYFEVSSRRRFFVGFEETNDLEYVIPGVPRGKS